MTRLWAQIILLYLFVIVLLFYVFRLDDRVRALEALPACVAPGSS